MLTWLPNSAHASRLKHLSRVLVLVLAMPALATALQALDDDPVAWWSFDEGAGYFAGDEITGMEDSVRYVFNKPRFKPATEPMWRPGIRGSALFLDGYSTWIERRRDEAPFPQQKLTISAWVAPRSYEWGLEGRLTAIVNQHDREAGEGYILGMLRHGSWALKVGVDGAWHELFVDDRILERHTWSFVTAMVDAAEGSIRLFHNGELVAAKDIPAGGSITPTGMDLLIGKNNKAMPIGRAFSAHMFSGLLDELKLFHETFTDAEVAAWYQAYLKDHPGGLPQPDLDIPRATFDGDRHRPQYHFIPPHHWMNEPHAPIHFEDKYHIFYQYNPRGPYWHHIHWGHAYSDDMVHWVDLPIALAPERGAVDPDGIWSGSATVDEDGVPVLFYTAGDDSKQPNQMTAIARSTWPVDGDPSLTHWEKHDEPVTVQQEGQGIFGQFRDPFVWKEDGRWYQLVGSGIEGEGGTALLFTSDDMYEWTYEKPFFVGDYSTYPMTGQVWELPVFLPISVDKHILLVNPWFFERSPHNIKYVWYWKGSWDTETLNFEPDHEEPRRFDVGQHFTGPSGMVDGHGRSIVFSIAQDSRPGWHRYDSGWAFNAGLPIILSLHEDGRLQVKPIPELETLRDEHLISITESVTVSEANNLIGYIGGDMLEIKVEFENVDAERYGIQVRRSPDEVETTLLYYDESENELGIDRRRSSLKEEVWKGIQGGTLDLRGETLRLHIYLDRSMVEAYANDLKALTSRVYPTRADSRGMRIWSEGDVIVRSLDVWRLHSAYGEVVPAFYEDVQPGSTP